MYLLFVHTFWYYHIEIKRSIWKTKTSRQKTFSGRWLFSVPAVFVSLSLFHAKGLQNAHPPTRWGPHNPLVDEVLGGGLEV